MAKPGNTHGHQDHWEHPLLHSCRPPDRQLADQWSAQSYALGVYSTPTDTPPQTNASVLCVWVDHTVGVHIIAHGSRASEVLFVRLCVLLFSLHVARGFPWFVHVARGFPWLFARSAWLSVAPLPSRVSRLGRCAHL